jgi:hypothetical protein
MKYKVTISKESFHTIVLEADSEDAAMTKAEDLFSEDEINFMHDWKLDNSDVIDLEEIKE